jgi:hypothetical protein
MAMSATLAAIVLVRARAQHGKRRRQESWAPVRSPLVFIDAYDRILTCVASKFTMVSEAPKTYVLRSDDPKVYLKFQQ